MGRTLTIITGPTAVGKSDYAVELALECSSPVISCDSRQIYKEMTIGTAVPEKSLLSKVKHYFIQDHSVCSLYTAGMYELEALSLIERLFEEGHERLVACGGSGFYIDALCNGLDEIPEADPSLREELTRRMREEGIESLRMDLSRLDPEAYSTIDLANPARVLRAVEVCLLSGRPFSSFKLKSSKKRPFEIEKICLTMPREKLYGRINSRVIRMMDEGLEQEARSLMPLRSYTALQTVGYKELFSYFDFVEGRPSPGAPRSLDEAVSMIRTNTRRYAKKQISWWKRDPSVIWKEL